MGQHVNLTIKPITLRAANEVVRTIHRHHGTAQGCVFCLQVVDEQGECHGVVIVGRPVARLLQDGLTCEVTRLASDGYPNVCSKLYAAAQRVAKAMGYRRILTYTLEDETGASLRASNWVDEGPAGGGSWSRTARPRTNPSPTGRKRRWSRAL